MIIEVDMDSVTINGQTVARPDRIARTVWLRYWETVKRLTHHERLVLSHDA